MKILKIVRYLPITRYWIGMCLLAIACGGARNIYPLLAFFGGMIIMSVYKDNK